MQQAVDQVVDSRASRRHMKARAGMGDARLPVLVGGMGDDDLQDGVDDGRGLCRRRRDEWRGV